MTPSAQDILGFDVTAALTALREKGSGMPPHTYTSAAVFDLEADEIHSKSWTCFAPLEKLKDPGSVVVGNVGKTPIVVTRSMDGELHGFINVCRHRGYPVAVGDQTGCKKLTCRYHAWTYRLDGSLVVAPEATKDFDKSDHGLLPVSVQAWAQFVFVNPDPNAQPFFEALPGIQDVAAAYNMKTDLDDYKLVDMTEVHQKANWKLWFDNNCECYHCPTIHGESFADAFQSSAEAYTYEPHGLFTATAIEPKDKYDNTDAAFTIHMYPGCHIVQQKDIMIMARSVPHGADSYTVYTHYFAERGADPDDVSNWIKIWKQTYNEDKDALELQQRGLNSGKTKPYNYILTREMQPVHHVSNSLLAYERILGQEKRTD